MGGLSAIIFPSRKGLSWLTRLAPGTLAFVADAPSFYDDLAAAEHIELVLAANRAEAERPRAEHLLERFGLAGHERLLPSAYSRGMCEKLTLVLALMLASRASMAFVVDDDELYAARQSLRFLSFVNAGAYKEACRRRRFRREKRARRAWGFRPGRAALVSHGLLSLVRRPPTLPDLFSWSALLVPSGTWAVVALFLVGLASLFGLAFACVRAYGRRDSRGRSSIKHPMSGPWLFCPLLSYTCLIHAYSRRSHGSDADECTH